MNTRSENLIRKNSDPNFVANRFATQAQAEPVFRRGKELGELLRPSRELVLITDFSSAKGAKRDDRSPNECLLEVKCVCRANGVQYEAPIQDNGVYALRPISGAYHNEIYARRLGEMGIPRVQVVVCDPGVGSEREGIVVETAENAFYVGPNNGVFWETIKREGIATGEDGQPVVYKVKDEIFQNVKSATFHGREVFAPIAGELVSGKEPHQLSDWLDRFDPENLVQLNFQENQILEIDGFNLIHIFTKVPDDNPTHARVTVTDRKTLEEKTLILPTAEKYVDESPGSLMIYPGSSWGLAEIASSMAVHEYEPTGPKQLSVDASNPIEPGDILNIEWLYDDPSIKRKGI